MSRHILAIKRKLRLTKRFLVVYVFIQFTIALWLAFYEIASFQRCFASLHKDKVHIMVHLSVSKTRL